MERTYEINLNRTTTEDRPEPAGPRWETLYALEAAVAELEQLTALAIATPRPVKGWRIRVYQPGRAAPTLDQALTHWGDFFPNSAGHHLINYGWMPYSCAHYVRTRAAGWAQHTPDNPHPRAAGLPGVDTAVEMWTAPVHPDGWTPTT